MRLFLLFLFILGCSATARLDIDAFEIDDLSYEMINDASIKPITVELAKSTIDTNKTFLSDYRSFTINKNGEEIGVALIGKSFDITQTKISILDEAVSSTEKTETMTILGKSVTIATSDEVSIKIFHMGNYIFMFVADVGNDEIIDRFLTYFLSKYK